MEKIKNYDFEVTVGMIKLLFPRSEDPESDSEVKLFLLPIYSSSLPYYGARTGEVNDSLKEAGIKNQTLHYGKICCDDFAHLLNYQIHSDKPMIELFREYDPTEDEFTYIGRRVLGRKRLYYCPFCGKRSLFTWKLLGTFKLGKKKKEVCTYFYELVNK